jgi:uncharacterized membrane protein YhaH (DUF805 family)
MNWFIQVIKNYATFSGRAQRAEYWYFVLFYVLIYLGLSLLDGVTGTFDSDTGAGLLGSIFVLAILIPSLAVTVRRLHDTDRSGWWLLIGLIPIIGGLVLLVFTVLDGTTGANTYGENPKSIAAPI